MLYVHPKDLMTQCATAFSTNKRPRSMFNCILVIVLLHIKSMEVFHNSQGQIKFQGFLSNSFSIWWKEWKYYRHTSKWKTNYKKWCAIPNFRRYSVSLSCARTELHTHQASTLIQVCQAEAERRQDEPPCYHWWTRWKWWIISTRVQLWR